MSRDMIDRAATLRTRARLALEAADTAADRGDHALARDLRWQADECDELADEVHFHLTPADGRAAWAEYRARMARHHGCKVWSAEVGVVER